MGREDKYSGWATNIERVCKIINRLAAQSSTIDYMLQSGQSSASQASTASPLLQKGNGSTKPVIRRIENGSNWYEIKGDKNKGYEYRSRPSPVTWIKCQYTNADHIINQLVNLGWQEVLMNHDPNDVQPVLCAHEFEVATDNCMHCGMPWSTAMFDFAECCKGGNFYTQGKWHATDCQKVAAPTQITPKQTPRCTCGSSSLGSDRHSDYCDIK